MATITKKDGSRQILVLDRLKLNPGNALQLGYFNKNLGLNFSGDYYLTSTEYNNKIIRFTGSLSSDSYIIVPNDVGAQWTLRNDTTGNFNLYVKTESQSNFTAVVIPQNGSIDVFETDDVNAVGSGYAIYQSNITDIPVSGFEGICDENANIGDLIYISARIGNIPVFSKVAIEGENINLVSGIILKKKTLTTCVVITSGSIYVPNASFLVGQTYFVDIDGRPTPTMPIPNLTSILVQQIGIATSVNTLNINIQPGTILIP